MSAQYVSDFELQSNPHNWPKPCCSYCATPNVDTLLASTVQLRARLDLVTTFARTRGEALTEIQRLAKLAKEEDTHAAMRARLTCIEMLINEVNNPNPQKETT